MALTLESIPSLAVAGESVILIPESIPPRAAAGRSVALTLESVVESAVGAGTVNLHVALQPPAVAGESVALTLESVALTPESISSLAVAGESVILILESIPPRAAAGGSVALTLESVGEATVAAGTVNMHVELQPAAPAAGAWSEAACAQPAAIEVFCGRDRLITNCGWSPGGNGPEAMRLTSAGSTLSVGEGSCGVLARGKIGKQFGARLKGGPTRVTARRQENPQGAWLELAHDGWEAAWGVRHERLLYLDRGSDELRGEDRLVPPVPSASTRMAPVAVRFHLHPSVKASLARDRKSVLLQGPTTSGWWLRNDAQDVSIEHSVHYENGQPKRSTQVVLRSHIPCGEGGKIRWKLAAMTRGD